MFALALEQLDGYVKKRDYDKELAELKGKLEKIKQEQTEMPELQQFVNLWTFANNRFTERLIFQEVQRWNGEAPDYRPMGGTPLNDAIGNAL
jgi:hypothetical protein